MTTSAPIFIAPRDPMAPPPPRVSAARAQELVDKTLALLGTDLVPQRLLPGQRQHLAGKISWHTRPLVHEVAHDLAAHPDLFPELRFDAAEVREHQDAADRWRTLRAYLLTLADLAQDAYVTEQTKAQDMAEELLRNVKMGVENPAIAPHLPHADRLAAVRLAFLIVEKYKADLVARRQGKKPASPKKPQVPSPGDLYRAQMRARFGDAMRAERAAKEVPQLPPPPLPPPPPPAAAAPPPARPRSSAAPVSPEVPRAHVPTSPDALKRSHAILVDIWALPDG